PRHSLITQRTPIHHPLSPVFFLPLPRRPPPSTLFPYTTLFRSVLQRELALQQLDQCRHEVRVIVEVGGKMRVPVLAGGEQPARTDRKSTRLNSSHVSISYAVFCLKKKKAKILSRTHRVVSIV